MLVLTRKLGENIVIGSDIKITLLAVNLNGVVKLGITAPKDVEVFREEITLKDDFKRGPHATR